MDDRAKAPSGSSVVARRAMIAASFAALLWALLARGLGPSDLWDQTQPRTISYTTDIIAHGRWILPRERGEHAATKPPLYNWLAVPAVKALGFSSEAGHKLPSMLALIAVWLALLGLGRRTFPGTLIGAAAATAFVANYAIFKLGFLARPDMVLTAWMVLGWWAATEALTERGRGGQRWPQAIFWICVGLAALTKGPVALVLPVYAVLAARLLAGSWSAFGALRPGWGIPLALAIGLAWVGAVAVIDPVHLRDELWLNEIWGRVTGLGPEGSREGPIALLLGLPDMTVYYVTRFGPWSVISIAAMVLLPRLGASPQDRRLSMLRGAALMVIVGILAFTLSAGKRSDYIAFTHAPGAVLAAWWCLESGPRVVRRRPWLVPLAAAVMLIVLTVRNEREPAAPHRGFGDGIMDFACEAEARMRSEPLPTAILWDGDTGLRALLGVSGPGGPEHVLALVEAGEPFWAVTGRGDTREVERFTRWLRRRAPEASCTLVARSREMAHAGGWPTQVSLSRVEP